MPRARVAGSLGALTALLLGCPVSTQPEGAEGREGVARFVAETDLVFSTLLVVGSRTTVTVAPVKDDAPLPEGATLQSSDAALLTVGEVDDEGAWPVTLAAAGQADLQVVDAAGTVVDAIAVRAAVPGATTLVDGDLLAASSEVDARLPAQGWGFLVERELSLLVSAVDRCGGDMLDLHASTVRLGEGTPETVTVAETGPAQFKAESSAAGDVDLVLETPGLEPLTYPVEALEPGAVDEVHVAASSADGSGLMRLWGRAFANDVEVVGPLSFSWRADPRVALSALQGPTVEVQIDFPGDGEPPDDRPATVTAELFGEEGTTDLFTARQELDRGTPARTASPSGGGGGGCGGDACDPFAAAGLLGAWLLHRRARALHRRLAAAPRHG